jgi:hypothetical protein
LRIKRVDRRFDCLLGVVARFSKRRFHRRRNFDLALAIAAPEKLGKVLEADRSTEFSNVLTIVCPSICAE